MKGEKVKFSAFLVQALATFAIAFLTCFTGFIFAWPSYTLENYASNHTVLSRPMSTGEISILGSLTNIGAMVANPFCGYAVNGLGRKYSAMIFGLPFVLTWTILIFTKHVPLVIAAMGIAGIGAAGQGISSIYIAEICYDSIRGAFTTAILSGYLIGLLASYIMGGYMSYYQMLYANLTLAVLYIVMLTFLKESPVFLMQRGKEEEAAQSIAFYRRVDVTSEEVEIEIRKIKLQLDPNIVNILQDGGDDVDLQATKELLTEKPKERQPVSAWKFLMTSKTSQRALFTSLFLVTFSVMMGAVVLQVYAEPLFKEAVPSINSNTCAILLAVDLLISCFVCAFTVDRFGRKFLATYSSIGSGLLTLLLASQLQFHFSPHWVTALLIYSYNFINNIGGSAVPCIFISEVFLPEARGLCNSIVMTWVWMSTFLILVIFNPLVESFGLGPVFYGFSAISFSTALFCHYCLPETKGLSADAIQLLFLKKRDKKVCAR